MTVVPNWVRSYHRQWLRPDLVAGLVVWSVVTPQAVAYAQIAGLPPAVGLVAAPGALIGYALVGGSHALVVGATTSTAALSAAAVGPLAHGNAARFAALSAALALVAAVVLAGSGALRLGGVSDLISKPVMTGFLFGLGLTIAIGQLPKLFGVEGGSGNFFEKLWDFAGDLGDAHGLTVVVGAASVALLVAGRRLVPRVPSTLLVLGVAIAGSALFDLRSHEVAVVGKLPNALPDPALPDVSWHDTVELLPAAFGVMLLSTEGIGVGRAVATAHGYAVNPSRELAAFGGANLLAGLSSGFVQSGGSSQTAAAERAGGRTQLASLVAAALVLLTGTFLAPVFTDLPQATLGAIVIVAVTGFFRVDELRRFARIRRSAIVLAVMALAGVLVLGVLPGLVITAAISLAGVIYRLSRPQVGVLARDPASGAWGRADRHPAWDTVDAVVVTRVEGPLFYGNAVSVKDRLLARLQAAEKPPRALVLELDQDDLDVETLDMLVELADALAIESVELRLAAVRVPAAELLRRARVLFEGARRADARRRHRRRRGRPRTRAAGAGPRRTRGPCGSSSPARPRRPRRSPSGRPAVRRRPGTPRRARIWSRAR
jgi:sulfate permease, SulP family